MALFGTPALGLDQAAELVGVTVRVAGQVEGGGGGSVDQRARQASKPQATKAAPAKAAKRGGPAKLSALEAAAKVLGETGQAMNCQELIEAMAAKGYWKSPAGKTPAATLYASLIKEIAAKGKESRFKKTDRGRFART